MKRLAGMQYLGIGGFTDFDISAKRQEYIRTYNISMHHVSRGKEIKSYQDLFFQRQIFNEI